MNVPTSPTNMTAGAPAPMGHNQPPAFDPNVLASRQVTAEEFLEVTKMWQSVEKIESETQAEQLNDQITGLRKLWKKVDADRKAAKKPHDDAGREVQTAFNPLLKKLAAAADALKSKLSEFAAEKQRREDEAREQAQQDAEAKQAEAARLVAEAAASGDISAQVDAEEAQKAAEKQAKAAAKRAVSGIKSASGGGRTMSVRTIREVEVTNVRLLFMHYQNHPDVAEVLRRIATADVRAKGFDPEETKIPGITITERKSVA